MVGYISFKRKNGIKRSLVVDGRGIPLSYTLIAANEHDITPALSTVDAIIVGRRRARPKRLGADKGYDSVPFRQALRARGIQPAIAYRGWKNRHQPERSWNDRAQQRYARQRWRVEQRFACLSQQRRLEFLYEKTFSSYAAFLEVAFIGCYLKLLAKCRK